MNASPVTSDPVITEIVRNGVVAITEEMKSNLMRTAYNMIIYEALDFTVGLFTPKGETGMRSGMRWKPNKFMARPARGCCCGSIC